MTTEPTPQPWTAKKDITGSLYSIYSQLEKDAVKVVARLVDEADADLIIRAVNGFYGEGYCVSKIKHDSHTDELTEQRDKLVEALRKILAQPRETDPGGYAEVYIPNNVVAQAEAALKEVDNNVL